MKKSKGVLTVEAALVVPLFVFFIMYICQFMKIVYVYDTVQTNIYNTAKFINGYSYLAEATKLNNFVDESGSLGDLTVEGLITDVQGIFSGEVSKDKVVTDLVNKILADASVTGVGEAIKLIAESNLDDELKSRAQRLGVDNFNFDGTKVALGKGGDIRIVVEYNINVEVPFLANGKNIKLKNQVVIKSFSGV